MAQESKNVRIPQQSRSKETKEQIVDAAEEMFRQHGFHGTNTKEIAKHAKVAVGSVYAYFKNKKELYMVVLEGYSRKIFEQIRGITIDFTPRPNRSEYFLGLLKTVITAHYAPELHRDLYSVFPHDKEVQRIALNWQKEAVGEFYQALAKAGDKLAVDDIEASAVLLHTFIETLVQRITVFGTLIDHHRLLREFAVMLDRYLQAPLKPKRSESPGA